MRSAKIAKEPSSDSPVMTFISLPASQMRHQLLNCNHGQRTFAVVLQTGGEAIACRNELICANNISAAQSTRGDIASAVGDMALSRSGEPSLHIQVVIGKCDGAALAGHLQEAHIRPTLEVILSKAPAQLQMVRDPQSDLALIRPKQ